MTASSLPELDPRARRLLRSLIAQYIRDGEPVGSRTLAKSAGLQVSAATIRNVMADLEEIGLVAAPHTSAGRIPTAQGLRVFVDSLLQVKPLGAVELARLRSDLPDLAGTQELVTRASMLLSAATRFVGVVTVPKRERFALRHIDFVSVGPRRLLVILVFSDNEVQNRVIETARDFTPSELEQVANMLNERFSGRSLHEIQRELVGDLRQARDAIDALMSSAVELAESALQVDSSDDMVVSGQTNLMGVRELADLDRLRELFDTFARKRDLLQLMERCVAADGVRIFIGEETGNAALGQCAMVTAPYGVEGQVLGVLGVIGPTRMAYEKVIPVVQATAGLVSAALNQSR